MGPASRPALPADGAAVAALLEANGLEAEFVAAEFRVIEDAGGIVACGRLKRLPGGALELASVAVAQGRRGAGLGDRVTRDLLRGAARPVFALALAPGFFARHGFVPVPAASLPEALAGKANGMCASTGFVAMRLAA